MAGKRLTKQILYGAGYLAVLFLLIFIVYLLWFKPAPTCFDNKQNQNETGVDCGGPCPACEIRTLNLLESSQIKFFPADNQTVIAAEIKNLNSNYGADSFVYTFEVYGIDGAEIKRLSKNSFIYAGEVKYLVEPVEINFKNVKEVKISFSDINWKSSEEFPKPIIQLRETKTESATPGGAGIIINGVVANSNAFLLSKIRIIGLLFNQIGIQISASKTELENISAFEEKLFKINFPKNISLMPTSTAPQINLTQADPSKTRFYVEAIR